MIKLTGNKIAVAPILDPDKSSGGLWIPDIAKERADQGIVKYVGPDVKTLQPGDYILFSGYSGTVVNFGDNDGVLIIFREEFAVCKLGEVATSIKGLYFKERFNVTTLYAGIARFLTELGFIVDSKSDNVINGLIKIFNDNDPYFEAPYEVVVNMVAEAWRNTNFAMSIYLSQPTDSGRKKVAANPDYSHDEILRIQENEDG